MIENKQYNEQMTEAALTAVEAAKLAARTPFDKEEPIRKETLHISGAAQQIITPDAGIAYDQTDGGATKVTASSPLSSPNTDYFTDVVGVYGKLDGSRETWATRQSGLQDNGGTGDIHVQRRIPGDDKERHGISRAGENHAPSIYTGTIRGAAAEKLTERILRRAAKDIGTTAIKQTRAQADALEEKLR